MTSIQQTDIYFKELHIPISGFEMKGQLERRKEGKKEEEKEKRERREGGRSKAKVQWQDEEYVD